MYQIRFRLGLRHRFRWGSLQRSTNPLATFKGAPRIVAVMILTHFPSEKTVLTILHTDVASVISQVQGLI